MPNGIERIVAVDFETNGFRGELFAIGAVAAQVGTKGNGLPFIGRCPIIAPKDPFVLKHSEPAMANLPTNFSTTLDMFCAFSDWLEEQYSRQTMIVVDHRGAETVAYYLYACRKQLSHLGPLIFHELSTMFLMVGLNPHYDRRTFANVKTAAKHHPVYDAVVIAACAQRLLRQPKPAQLYR